MVRSNFINVRIEDPGTLIVSGRSEAAGEIEALHITIGPMPDVIASALVPAGELVAPEAQLEHVMRRPVPVEWSTTIDVEAPFHFREQQLVVIAGAALRSDPKDPGTRLEPDVWVGSSRILSADAPKD